MGNKTVDFHQNLILVRRVREVLARRNLSVLRVRDLPSRHGPSLLLQTIGPPILELDLPIIFSVEKIIGMTKKVIKSLLDFHRNLSFGGSLVFTFLMAIIALAQPSLAKEVSHDDHGSQIFHAIKLETGVGTGRDGTLSTWHLDGWIGGNDNKLWLKSEGESLEGKNPENAEYWAMYSRNIAIFWDAQVGVRYDEQPNSTTYVVAGFNGLAPYLFETEAHLFVSDNGDVTAQLRQENDLLITQKLITQPYFEVNFSAQDVPEREIGAGLTSGEFGLQTRYEITRKFAPYIDLRYERKFGETSSIAVKHGENRDDAIASIGLRLMF